MYFLYVALVLAASFPFTLTAAEVPMIVCIGDSITHGDRDKGGDHYPLRLEVSLAGTAKVLNCGMNGGGMVSTDWQVYRGGPEHRQAVTAMGRILVVMLGTNDIAPWNRAEAPAHFTADYAAFVAELLALPQRPQVVLCTPPAIDTSFPGIDAPHEEVMTATINPAIQAVAKARKLPVIDVHAACAGKAGLLADGVHPNSAGNQVLAETIQAGLAALFRKPAKTAAPR